MRTPIPTAFLLVLGTSFGLGGCGGEKPAAGDEPEDDGADGADAGDDGTDGTDASDGSDGTDTGGDTGAPAPLIPYDAEAAPVECAVGGAAPLLDGALLDAGLEAGAFGFTDADWAAASYARYLDDAFLLSWFHDTLRDPLRVPCVGAQHAADLDAAAASAHPVATALGEAYVRIDAPVEAGAPDPTRATQSLASLDALPDELAAAMVPILSALEVLGAAHASMSAGAPGSPRLLVPYGHGGVLLDLRSAPDLTEADQRAWVLDPEGPVSLFGPARALAWTIEEMRLLRFAGADAALDLDSPLGRIIVAGPGPDAPGPLDAVLLYIDLGGDDTYVHAAGANGEASAASVHIDLGGDDVYGYVEIDAGGDGLLPADEDGRYAGDGTYGPFSLSKIGRQGSGRFGVGLLFDLGGGHDTYRSLRASQGWGHLGVGVLYDDGGDDRYEAEAGAQGAASMGVGLLIDQGGDDQYHSFADSQGFGYIRGAGFAWDGGGHDVWAANPGKVEDGGRTIYYSPQLPGNGNASFSQGVGFGMRNDGERLFLSGGIGVLRDRAGDDSYLAGTFAQGSGYWQGTGFLLDGGGVDRYDAYYYVQGGAAHYALGALLDDGPEGDLLNSILTPNFMHFGAGHDFSVGVHVNEGGDDIYTYAGLGAGASNCQGVGLFVDNDGVDQYTALSDYTTGLGNHSTECATRTAARSMGLFVDGGGDIDTYVFPAGVARATPVNDAVFGIEWTGGATEHGGAIDGDGATTVHAAGRAP